MSPRSFAEIVERARTELRLTNRQLAELAGVSLRSVERHAGTAVQWGNSAHKVVTALHPRNRDLAHELAMALGTTLEALGLEQPKPPAPPAVPTPAPSPPVVVAPPPKPEPPPAKQEHADSVVLAGSRVLQIPPEAIQPAVAAVIRRAAEMGVDLHSLARLLAPPPAQPPAANRDRPPASNKRAK